MQLMKTAYESYGMKYAPPIAAGVGLGMALSPDEAEAMPLEPFEKAAVKEAARVLGKEPFSRGKLWEIMRRMLTPAEAKYRPSSMNRRNAIRMMKDIESSRGTWALENYDDEAARKILGTQDEWNRLLNAEEWDSPRLETIREEIKALREADPESRASYIMQRLAQKGVIKQKIKQGAPTMYSKYVWGPHPEAREALGLEPLPRAKAYEQHFVRPGGRYSSYEIGGPWAFAGAREMGYKGKAKQILQQMRDEGALATFELPPAKPINFWRHPKTKKLEEMLSSPSGPEGMYQDLLTKVMHPDFAEWEAERLIEEAGGLTKERMWAAVRQRAQYDAPRLRAVGDPGWLGNSVARRLAQRLPHTPPPEFDAAYERIERNMQRLIEQRRQEAEMQAREGIDVYHSKPLALAPITDVLKRVIDTADAHGVVDYKKAKQLMPSEFQRFGKELGQAFSNRPQATAAELEAWKYELSKSKYRYAFEENVPSQGAMRSFFGGLDKKNRVHYLQIWGNPKELPAFTGHAYPASAQHRGIPSVGWFRVVDRGDAWVVEEIQSDMQARQHDAIQLLKKTIQEGRPTAGTPEQVREQLASVEKDQKYISDWADYGLASLLDEARKNGVGMVMIANPDAVAALWGGRLGEAKATTFYKDLPKRFGFKLDSVKLEELTKHPASYGVQEPRITNLTSFSSRIPIFIATALGAGALASMF
ncbi:MAG: hypothetical protein ACWGQW_04750, partial [bacterium]